MKVLKRCEGSGNPLLFWCPGCEEFHGVWIRPEANPATGAFWTWNGDLEKPTFSPSVLVHISGNKPRCHFYVENGFIRYLSDCGHALAGKTVQMKPDPIE